MANLIFNKLNELLINADNKWITRKRKINTKLLFEFMSQLIYHKKGINHLIAINYFKNNKYKITDAAICKARVRCGFNIFDQIKHKLVDHFFSSNNIYAVDGSKIRLPTFFSKEGFITRSPNSKPILAMISSIFDIKNKIPFNTLLCKHHNERTAVCDQLKYLPKNSTLIFDRGYYSKKMVDILSKNNIKYLFRLKKDANKNINNFFKYKKCHKKHVIVDGHKMFIFKYKIKNKIYLCGTNINQNINYLKKLYEQRWSVEEGFKTMKSILNLKFVHSKTNELLKQEIVIREILFVVSRYLQMNTKNKKLFYKSSFRLILDFIVNFCSTIFDLFSIAQTIFYNYQFKNIPGRNRI